MLYPCLIDFGIRFHGFGFGNCSFVIAGTNDKYFAQRQPGLWFLCVNGALQALRGLLIEKANGVRPIGSIEADTLNMCSSMRKRMESHCDELCNNLCAGCVCVCAQNQKDYVERLWNFE